MAADTSSGDQRIDVPTDPNAPRIIDARTSSGDVIVHRTGASHADHLRFLRTVADASACGQRPAICVGVMGA